MKLNVNFNKKTNNPEFSDDARKAITLLYFEEALYKERYEECGQLVQTAKRFGAEQEEISQIIAKHLKSAKRGFAKRQRNEAEEQTPGRRRV